jgi:hypothetical protein
LSVTERRLNNNLFASGSSSSRSDEEDAQAFQTIEFIRKILSEKLWLQSFLLDHFAVQSEQARQSFCRTILTVYPKPRNVLPLIQQAITLEVSTTGTTPPPPTRPPPVVDLATSLFPLQRTPAC